MLKCEINDVLRGTGNRHDVGESRDMAWYVIILLGAAS